MPDGTNLPATGFGNKPTPSPQQQPIVLESVNEPAAAPLPVPPIKKTGRRIVLFAGAVGLVLGILLTFISVNVIGMIQFFGPTQYPSGKNSVEVLNELKEMRKELDQRKEAEKLKEQEKDNGLQQAAQEAVNALAKTVPEPEKDKKPGRGADMPPVAGQPFRPFPKEFELVDEEIARQEQKLKALDKIQGMFAAKDKAKEKERGKDR